MLYFTILVLAGQLKGKGCVEQVDLTKTISHPNLVKAADGVKKATDEMKKVGMSLLTQLSIGDRTRPSVTAENGFAQGSLLFVGMHAVSIFLNLF